MSNIGEVLETARRARGMTQGDLADMVGVQQATLSRWEKGLREPDEVDVQRLADALGVTPRLLLRGDRMRGGIAAAAHMRRRATAKVSIWRQLEAQLNMLRLHTSTLAEEVSLTAERAVPTLDPIERDPSEIAGMVRLQWQMPLGPVASVTSWMESAGILIVEHDFGPAARVDGLSQWAGDHAVVLLNSATSPDRKRLTLAHELGHLVMHAQHPTDDMEGDANEFAAEFLVPAHEIRSMLRGRLTLSRFVELKRYWGVSIAALVMRAHSLGAISDAEKTSLFKQISARGWRINEPANDEIPVERPRLARHIADSMVAGGLSEGELAIAVGFSDAKHNDAFAPSVVTPRPTHAVRHLGIVR
ncbi:ImmA/IrrE family metallo-endopeptidase [Sanguibacter sp. HDW7]|uniref:helix-turn-helix domain-containing protein n=1 Tax=Sanguibacter sp. HDW7 TaxID=2714931 RepID=UPI00140DBDB2|nr:XRE family transcriptional regulator [Sanguibacter sp. HDW7]QIK82977.1 ImmA/IrrE family metallo-endopeptidase [Sanguibacter sp. HDW7]